jgi:hypothetical protein
MNKVGWIDIFFLGFYISAFIHYLVTNDGYAVAGAVFLGIGYLSFNMIQKAIILRRENKLREFLTKHNLLYKWEEFLNDK